MREFARVEFASIVGLVACLSWSYNCEGSAEVPPIDRLAPGSSFAVLSINDVAAMPERFKKTPLGQLLETPEYKAGFDSLVAESAKKDRAKELGVEVSDLDILPHRVGIAAFFERNEELDADTPALLATFDFGTDADAAQRVIEALGAESARESGKSVEEERLGERTVKVVPMPQEDPEEGESIGRPGGPPRPRVNMDPDFGSLFPTIESICYIREGSSFVFATSLAAMGDLCDVIDGRQAESLSDVKEYQAVQDQLGEQDGSVIVLFGKLEPLFSPLMQGPMGMVKDVLKTFVGSADALAIGGKVDGSVGMIELTGALALPEQRTGLIALASDAAPLGDPPVLGGDECTSYFRMNFNFAGVPALIEESVAKLPADQGDQVQAMLAMYMPALKKAFSALGPSVWSFASLDPQAPEGTRSVTSIACSAEKSVVPFLNLIMPQMGMMPSEFQGQTIFRGTESGADTAVGFAGSACVFGQSTSVEQAMRASSEPDAKSVAGSASYQAASRVTPSGNVIGWGYLDLVASIEQTRKALLAAETLADEDGFLDPSGNPLGALAPQIPEGMREAIAGISASTLAKHVGLMVYELRPSSGGIVYRLAVLPPAETK